MDLSPGHLQALTEKHLYRYRHRLALARAGAPGYREGELMDLIRIWKSVEEAGYRFEACNAPAQREIRDAIYDEDDE